MREGRMTPRAPSKSAAVVPSNTPRARTAALLSESCDRSRDQLRREDLGEQRHGLLTSDCSPAGDGTGSPTSCRCPFLHERLIQIQVPVASVSEPRPVAWGAL